LLNRFALFCQSQHAIYGSRWRGFHQRVDAAAAARSTSASGVKHDMTLIRCGECFGKIPLRLMRRESGSTEPAFLIAVGISDQHTLRSTVRLEMPSVNGLSQQLLHRLATAI
jgi:hypothetical protein